MTFTMVGAMPRKKYNESSFGESLQKIRKARALTQVQFAEAAHGRARQGDAKSRRHGKRFSVIATLPERDQKAVVRLIHSLVAGTSLRQNTSAQIGAQTGDQHGR